MSTDEVRTLSKQLKDLTDLLVGHIETFNEHVKKMDPIADRITQLTTVGDVVTFTEKFKGWAIWWAGLITPIAIISAAIVAIFNFLIPKGTITINKTSLNKQDVQEIIETDLENREFQISR